MSESVFPLNITDKEDHPDKTALLEGILAKYFESAAEVNKKTRALEELFLKYNSLTGGFQNSISSAETPLNNGLYAPTDAATYTNFGNLEYDPATPVAEGGDQGVLVFFIKKDAEYSKISIDLNIIPATEITENNLKYVNSGLLWNLQQAINSALGEKASQSALDALANEFNDFLEGKQDLLTFDEVPTKNSTNPVKGDGILNFVANSMLLVDKYIVDSKIPVTTTPSTFLQDNGTVVSVADFNTTDFLKLNNLDTFKILGLFNQACRVAYYDEDKIHLSTWTPPAGVGITFRDLTAPNGFYFKFCSNSETDNFIEVTTIKEVIEIEPVTEVYFATDGNDTTGDGTYDLPFLTSSKACQVLKGVGTAIAKNGDYVNEAIPLDIGETIIKGESQDGVRFLYGDRITTATLEDGYTKVYKKTGVNIPTYHYELWQHDIADTTQNITLAEREEIHGDIVERLTSYRLRRVASIQEVEDSLVPCFFMDGTTTIYFQKWEGSDLTVNPIISPIWNNIVNTKKLQYENCSFLYRPFILWDCTGYMKNVSVKFNNYTCFAPQKTTAMTFENCRACGSHEDGLNYFDTANCVEINCWSHNNLDEGSSTHQQVKIKRLGGLYEKNISGITDVGSSISFLDGVISKNNENEDYIFTYYPSTTDIGQAIMKNCIGTTLVNITGGAEAVVRVKAYNCPNAVASTYLEVN